MIDTNERLIITSNVELLYINASCIITSSILCPIICSISFPLNTSISEPLSKVILLGWHTLLLYINGPDIYSNSSNTLGALGALSTVFGHFDQWSGFINAGIEAGLLYLGPKGFGLQTLGKYSKALSKFGIGMIVAGSALSWGSSVYNNFTNPNYTTEEAFGASAIDAVYYAGKGIGTYLAGVRVGNLAVGLGVAAGGAAIASLGVGLLGAFAIGGGVAVLVGVAGASAIYYLGEGLDWLYGKFKEWLFE